MKKHLLVFHLFLPIIFLLILNRNLYSQENLNSRNIEGFWEATLEGEDFVDRFIYHIYRDDSQNLNGKVYSFRNNKKRSETVIDSLSFDKRILYMEIKTNVTIEYKGLFISENQSIGGELYYPNGVKVPWTLNRKNIISINEVIKQDSSKVK
jgi:hypothetical protein